MTTPRNELKLPVVISAIREIAPILAIVLSALALGYTIYSQKNETTRSMADKIRDNLAEFALQSGSLTSQFNSINVEIHGDRASIIREIEGVSVKPKTQSDLLRFIHPAIYHSNWYRRRQSTSDSIRSIASLFRGRLRMLYHVASLQIRIIEYPTSTEATMGLLGLDFDKSLFEECTGLNPKVASDVMQCIDINVFFRLKAMEELRINSFPESSEFLEDFGPLNGLGSSLIEISRNLNDFVQELTICLNKLPDKSLVELSKADGEASLGQPNIQDDLRRHIELVEEKMGMNFDHFERSCCDDEKECNKLK